ASCPPFVAAKTLPSTLAVFATHRCVCSTECTRMVKNGFRFRVHECELRIASPQLRAELHRFGRYCAPFVPYGRRGSAAMQTKVVLTTHGLRSLSKLWRGVAEGRGEVLTSPDRAA